MPVWREIENPIRGINNDNSVAGEDRRRENSETSILTLLTPLPFFPPPTIAISACKFQDKQRIVQVMRCFQACCSVEYWHINVLRPSIPRNTLTFPWDFEAGNTRPCSFIRGNNRQTDRHTAAETMARRILVKGGERWRNSCRRKFRKFRTGGGARDEPSDDDFGTGYFRPRLIKFKPFPLLFPAILKSSAAPR